MRDPSKSRLVLLAYGPVLYHCAINNRECIMLHLDDDQSSLQHRVVGLGRQMTHMLSVVRVADSRVAVRLYMKKYMFIFWANFRTWANFRIPVKFGYIYLSLSGFEEFGGFRKPVF